MDNFIDTLKTFSIADYGNMLFEILYIKKIWFDITFFQLILLVICIILGIWLIQITNMRILKKLDYQDDNSTLGEVVYDKISQVGNPFYIISIAYIFASFARLPLLLTEIIKPLLIIITAYYAIPVVRSCVIWLVKKSLIKKHISQSEDDTKSLIQIVSIIASVVLWIAFVLIVSQQLKWNLSIIIGSISISSVAVAFAIQNILADIFATFTIFVDKPFSIGDQVILDDHNGTVKKIGLKSTRIKLLDGDELVVANKDITSARLRNLKKLTSRRVSATLVLDSETSPEKIKIAQNQLKDILFKLQKENRLIIGRVNLLHVNSIGFVIEYIYTVPNQEYSEYCSVQETINYSLLSNFAKEGIKISTRSA